MTHIQWIKLSDIDRRIKVARCCNHPAMEKVPEPMEMWDGITVSLKTVLDNRGVPDYCHDLNAIHNAVMDAPTEDENFEGKYINHLRIAISSDHEEVNEFDIVHATASQRSEAFVLTMTGDTK